jgi:hypothetical protein
VPLSQACEAAIQDLSTLAGIEVGTMPVSIVALDAAGNHCSVSTIQGRRYVVQKDGMDKAALLKRKHVPFE